MRTIAARNTFLLALIACVVLIASGIAKTNAASPQPVTCAQYQASKADIPPLPTAIDPTCAVIPQEMKGTPEQGPADAYAWLTFIAVNWPADPTTCAANAHANIVTATPNPTWLSYLSDDAVFVAAGKPANWCNVPGSGGLKGAAFASAADALSARRTAAMAHLPSAVRELAEKHPEVSLFLHHSAKGDAALSAVKLVGAKPNHRLNGILDATGQPVTDQNGRFVRYTINMDCDEYSYITAKALWTAKGQKATGNLDFPHSGLPACGAAVGAMEFKAAWKVLGKGDVPSHFFTQQAIVYNDVGGSPSPGANPVTVGLVGLHITHKTPNQPRWLWATFEQTDIPTGFNNPQCPSPCPPNVETAKKPYVELNPNGTPRNKPVQVVGIIPSTAGSLNTTFQGLLGNTPWAHYKLISTQWVGELGITPKPAKLGNAVLETFVADTVPYSCLKCHSFAQTSPAGTNSDFSFMINAKQ